jgi:hypothetical protein
VLEVSVGGATSAWTSLHEEKQQENKKEKQKNLLNSNELGRIRIDRSGVGMRSAVIARYRQMSPRLDPPSFVRTQSTAHQQGRSSETAKKA